MSATARNASPLAARIWIYGQCRGGGLAPTSALLLPRCCEVTADVDAIEIPTGQRSNTVALAIRANGAARRTAGKCRLSIEAGRSGERDRPGHEHVASQPVHRDRRGRLESLVAAQLTRLELLADGELDLALGG